MLGILTFLICVKGLTCTIKDVNGLVMTFSNSISTSSLGDRLRLLTMTSESLYRYPDAISIGSRINTDNQLNMSWTVAPPKARRNSFFSRACPMETMVLVTLVPMLAPMTIGMACLTYKTVWRKGMVGE